MLLRTFRRKFAPGTARDRVLGELQRLYALRRFQNQNRLRRTGCGLCAETFYASGL